MNTKSKVVAALLIAMTLTSCDAILGTGKVGGSTIQKLQDGFATIAAKLLPAVGSSLADLADAYIGVVGQSPRRLSEVLDPATGEVSLDVDTRVAGAFDPLNANPSFDRFKYQLMVYDGSAGVGAKLDGVSLQEGAETSLSAGIQLQPSGSLTGTIALSDARSPLGATVVIPGTSFSATADAAGHFTLSGIPAGTYEMLRASLDGYYAGTVSNASVASAESTDVGSITLILSTGASGSILINQGAPFTASTTVAVSVGASANAVLMRISENEAFTGATWAPLQYSSGYSFSNPGAKRLYLSLADANGLASSVGYADIIVNTDPAGTYPQAPSGLTTSSLRPQFSWSALGDAAVIPDEAYDLQVSSDPAFGVLLVDQQGLTATSYTPSQDYLLADGAYHWRVRSRIPSQSLTGSWYGASFQLDASPKSLSPASAATLQPTLAWNQPFAGASYSLQISTAADASYLSASAYPGGSSLSGESFAMEGLAKALNDGSYRFRVRSQSSDGYVSDWSELSFTVSALPTALSSVNAANVNTPTLSWTKAYAAGSTEVQVDDNADFLSNEAASIKAGSSFTTPILPDGTYHWRSRTTVSAGSSTYTSQWTLGGDFAIDTRPTGLTSAAITNDDTPSLAWTRGYSSSTTEVQVDDNADFLSNEASIAASASAFTPTAALAEGTYHWRARTTVVSGSSTYASAWAAGDDFIIDTTPPTGSVTVNGGAATANDVNVTLFPSFADANGVASMRSANSSGALASASYVAYASSMAHSLASGDGAKTVYVQFKDNAGNESAPTAITSAITLEYGIVYVSTTGSDSNSGIRTGPKATLAAGLSLANSIGSAGQVRVAGGAYGIGSSTIYLSGGISLLGGYSPSDWNARNPATYATQIDFTDASGGYGGGQAAIDVSGSSSLSGFSIFANYPNVGGGYVSAITVSGSAPNISGNIVSAISPGGSTRVIYVSSGSPLLYNNIIYAYGSNPSGIFTGGSSTPAIYNNFVVMVQDTGFSSMGILMDSSSKPAVINNVFQGFTYVGWEQSLQADATSFSNNDVYGYGTFYYDADSPSISRSKSIAQAQALTDMTAANNLSVDLTTANYLSDYDGGDDNLAAYADNDWRWGTSAPSAVRTGGQDLSAYFTTDKDGVARGGTWSIGAYQ